MHRDSEQRYRSLHATRVMAAMAASLLLLVLLVRYWPAPSDRDRIHRLFLPSEQEAIAMEEVQPTRQVRTPPPPPAPLPPVVMPDDRILEDPLDLDADFLPLAEAGPPAPTFTESARNEVPLADTGPRPIMIAEPEHPRPARRRGIRAEVAVRVDIDRRGRVTAQTIIERYLLSEDGQAREPVATLGYGLEEAAISASKRWRFRPARKQGQAVSSQYVLTIRFGI